MYKISEVKPMPSYRVWIKYYDGSEGTVDLSDMVGKGVFTAWEDDEAFKNVSIGSSGELVWACGLDLCPDALYMKLTGKSAEDLFPTLRKAAAYA